MCFFHFFFAYVRLFVRLCAVLCCVVYDSISGYVIAYTKLITMHILFIDKLLKVYGSMVSLVYNIEVCELVVTLE